MGAEVFDAIKHALRLNQQAKGEGLHANTCFVVAARALTDNSNLDIHYLRKRQEIGALRIEENDEVLGKVGIKPAITFLIGHVVDHKVDDFVSMVLREPKLFINSLAPGDLGKKVVGFLAQVFPSTTPTQGVRNEEIIGHTIAIIKGDDLPRDLRKGLRKEDCHLIVDSAQPKGAGFVSIHGLVEFLAQKGCVSSLSIMVEERKKRPTRR